MADQVKYDFKYLMRKLNNTYIKTVCDLAHKARLVKKAHIDCLQEVDDTYSRGWLVSRSLLKN